MDLSINDWTDSKKRRETYHHHASDQLPTPDQTMPLAEFESGYYNRGGRGLRLTADEELCLVEICKENMENYNVSDHPKSFWMSMAEVFFIKCGRIYSWQSCRRRIGNYITNRKAYWAALDRGLPPPDHYMDGALERAVDKWMWECDAKWEAMQRRQEMENEQLAAAREKQRLEFEAHRKNSLKRVQSWVDNVPPPEEVKPLPRHWGEVPFLPNNRYRSPTRSRPRSHSRSRSRSPRRTEDDTGSYSNNQYRQRPKPDRPLRLSDLFRDQLVKFRSPALMAEQHRLEREREKAAQADRPKSTTSSDTKEDEEAKNNDAADNHQMHDAPAEPTQPIKEDNNTSSSPSPKKAERNDGQMVVPDMKAAIVDAVKSASAVFTKQMDELAENQAVQNQKFRESLKAIESAVHELYQNIGKVVENTLERAVDNIRERR